MSRALAERLTHLLQTVRRPGTDELWTSRDLVDAINADGDVSISYSYFSSLKNGVKDNPGVDILRAIARGFGLGVGALLDAPDISSADDLTQDELELLDRIGQSLIAYRRRMANGGPCTATDSSPTFATDGPQLTAADVHPVSQAAEALESAAAQYRQISDVQLGESIARAVEALHHRIGATVMARTSAASQRSADPSRS